MTTSGFQNLFKLPELKKRIVTTLMLLLVYRIGVHVPTPGINPDSLAEIFRTHGEGIVGMFNMFSGGALERLSVFALGIMPYISASIILQLMTVVVPHLEQLKKEGEQGQKKITQYTRYGTVLLSVIQGFGISVGLEAMHAATSPGWGFRIMTVITLTAGTAFIMWLGEQITERGIGNGISLIIFAGIIARMPAAVANVFNLISNDQMGLFEVLMLVAMMVGVIGFVIYMETAQRRIPVEYAKRVVGRKVYGGQSSHLPLKINTSGVIPPIFASSIIVFPTTVASFFPDVPVMKTISDLMAPGSVLYTVIFVAFIVFFCFFYTAIQFNPTDVAENMKKNGGYIPGIRPGKRTADYIDKVLTRITVVGAVYVSAICVLPTMLITKANVPFYFGGTALLIVVGVAIDTVAQMESHLVMRNYSGFLGDGKAMKGRR
ncbi:preprotein translocase subunit SecY [Desulfoluna butyratoxydans]|uniref:Protein translocase subunit SecY n=1 Tax=Desulfoluna butyratoxydans TaxID=231438 RepID=A0A4V6IL26_9BACT|nr:preprotein translocase subunit SecY [Desulfoluna butyratoxydans]VFQ43438.1 3a0501s007: preprotein translocase secy subunit [Desulfoluna butyratoxydans]